MGFLEILRLQQRDRFSRFVLLLLSHGCKANLLSHTLRPGVLDDDTIYVFPSIFVNQSDLSIEVLETLFMHLHC